MKKALFLLMLLAAAWALSACAPARGAMRDGYYTAEFSDFDQFGWKEFVTMYVNNNRIVSVDYDARNASGFVKSWDMAFMRAMRAQDGTYPNRYARGYAAMLLDYQNAEDIDALSGATYSCETFRALAAAAIDKAQAGDRTVALVERPSRAAQEPTGAGDSP